MVVGTWSSASILGILIYFFCGSEHRWDRHSLLCVLMGFCSYLKSSKYMNPFREGCSPLFTQFLDMRMKEWVVIEMTRYLPNNLISAQTCHTSAEDLAMRTCLKNSLSFCSAAVDVTNATSSSRAKSASGQLSGNFFTFPFVTHKVRGTFTHVVATARKF